MAADGPLYRAIMYDRPFVYIPFDDLILNYASFNGVPQEALHRITVVQGNTGITWSARQAAKGDRRLAEQGGTSWFNLGTSGFSNHAGANGLFSMECVWNPGAVSANSQMLLTKGAGSNYEFTLSANANGSVDMGFFTAAGGNVAVASAPAGSVVAGKSYIIGASYDRAAGYLALYINGVLAGSTTSFSSNTAAGSAQCSVGHRADAGGATISSTSLIGHISFYNAALSRSRFVDHYNAFRGRRLWRP